MSKLGEYIETDWAALTLHDWLGLFITVSVFFLMIGLYVYVFHPKNKDKLESQRYLSIDDDGFDAEEKKQ